MDKQNICDFPWTDDKEINKLLQERADQILNILMADAMTLGYSETILMYVGKALQQAGAVQMKDMKIPLPEEDVAEIQKLVPKLCPLSSGEADTGEDKISGLEKYSIFHIKTKMFEHLLTGALHIIQLVTIGTKCRIVMEYDPALLDVKFETFIDKSDKGQAQKILPQ